MAVLLLAEVNGPDLAQDATREGADRGAGPWRRDDPLRVGWVYAAAADTAATLDGAARVLCADDAAYGNGLAEPVADLVISLAGDLRAHRRAGHRRGQEPCCRGWRRSSMLW